MDLNVVKAIFQVVLPSHVHEEVIILILKDLLVCQLAPPFGQSTRIWKSLNKRPQQLVDS